MTTRIVNCSLLALGGMLLSTSVMAETASSVPSFTKGAATKILNPELIDCGYRSRNTSLGQITSEDGKVWTVPAENAEFFIRTKS